MNDAIRITDQGGRQAASARDLHTALGAKRDFSTWIKDRIEKFGFQEGKDYQSCSPNSGSKTHGGSNKLDYFLSLPAAKEIAASDNSDAGRKIRLYLIKAEEAWNTPEMVMARALQLSAKTIEAYKNRIAALEPKGAYYDALVDRGRLSNFRDTAKELGVAETQFIEFLLKKRYAYRDANGEIRPYASRMRFFALKDFYDRKAGHAGTQTLITAEGKLHFLRLFGAQDGNA